ncbi:MAG: site-2 protease family protein [Acidobacteriota bacterium]|nr:site-2 protease family protein [Acidobacteriota bacterium]MDH3530288.1 site-2 protease family protein [Acidobacteriota bacterium]
MGGIDPAVFVSNLAVFLVVLLLAISVHEAAHAWVSYKFGDDTAYMLGRVTLNPVKHTDPIGTLLIPTMAFLFGALGGAYASVPLIGWGKPTPVNPSKWSNYKWGNFSVSIAGVVANLILVFIGLILAKILMTQGAEPRQFLIDDTGNPLIMFTGKLMVLNLSLFVFNLLPIPPLDGGKILSSFLPESFQPVLDFIEQFGFIILLFLIWQGVFGIIIYPFFILLFSILNSI